MPQANPDLLHLLDVTSRSLPGLNGRVGDAHREEFRLGAAYNRDHIAALHEHWRLAHPEAGPHYWSTRSWTLLIWQPIYLCLLGVHLAQRAPCLAQMGQSVNEGFVSGFCLPEHCPRQAAPQRLIELAAEQLREQLAHQLVEFQGVVGIKAKMANRLAADYVLAALLFIQRQQGFCNGRAHALECQWLDALSLQDESSLIDVHLDDGRERLALGRKVCCQHFRRADGALCSTCPKIREAERIERLRQELAAEC
ncbi:siderophore ferric iron reductase [Pseudomonas matsuisoli]|uniref:Siderophore ferric iron reductase n=1 Tax=Pseudomonas matsuisoli TaxID=1515666 RepID=A0A917Q0K2_9PSED|nr:siderophore ferric iron reductase [Pseudomonas matsuisoli]GGK04573.1 siderophore ferric iron reductase [Pseudomonas matsuisoli]